MPPLFTRRSCAADAVGYPFSAVAEASTEPLNGLVEVIEKERKIKTKKERKTK